MKLFLSICLLFAAHVASAARLWVVAPNYDHSGWTFEVVYAFQDEIGAVDYRILWLDDTNQHQIAQEIKLGAPDTLALIGHQAGNLFLTQVGELESTRVFNVQIASNPKRIEGLSQVVQKTDLKRSFALLAHLKTGIESIAFIDGDYPDLQTEAKQRAKNHGFEVVDIDQASPQKTAIATFDAQSVKTWSDAGYFVISPWHKDIGRGAIIGGGLDGNSSGRLLAQQLLKANAAQLGKQQLLQLRNNLVWADYQGLLDRGISPSNASHDVSWVNHYGVTFEDKAASVIGWLVAGLVGLLIVMTWMSVKLNQQRRIQKDLNRLALNDSLTGLANREGFITHVEARLSQAKSNDQHVMVFIDLDRFRNVNDRFGHDIGNSVIRLVAERVSGIVRSRDLTARISADQFAVFLDGIVDVDGVERAMDKICDSLGLPFVVGGVSIQITASIGVAHYPDDSKNTLTLMRQAESAMFNAKTLQEVSWSKFDEALNESQEMATKLAEDLREAIASNELYLLYQPIIDLQTQKIAGVEALLRWQHPTLGAIPPPQILQIARDSDLLLTLGDWVLMTACRQGHAWQRLGHELRMNVNVTPEQFSDAGLVARVQQMLFESGMDPKLLTLEITEDATLEQPAQAESALDRLSSIGVTAAIDDFGTGYSSLGRLKRFKLRALKIDRSFVTDLATDVNDRAINRAIVQIAQSMEIKVVAEGIETAEQLMLLRLEGCDYGQGYYFSKPAEAREIVRLMLESPWSKSA